jgi:hypothetical protein
MHAAKARVALDRKKHDFDVMERVLGVDEESGVKTDVVDVEVRPWIGGSTTSVVQLTILPEVDRLRGRGEDED